MAKNRLGNTTLMMVTYNRLPLTKKMLDYLAESTNRNYNLVIVDNGSTDDTLLFLDEFSSSWNQENGKLVIFKNDVNKGIAIGRNQALKIANELNSEWYCTIDNDVKLPINWLQDCVDILISNPEYAAIGANMEDVVYPLVQSNGFTFQCKPQGNLGTACMVFHKSLHQLLGYFNTEYGPYGEEDADFGMRIRVLGLKLGYLKEMGVHFGVGKDDSGKYREWKTECHNKNLKQFNSNCGSYFRKEKSLYIPYKD